MPCSELTDAPIDTKAFFTGIERSIRDHLTRTLTLELPTNTELKLYGRPGEPPADFTARCARTRERAGGHRDRDAA